MSGILQRWTQALRSSRPAARLRVIEKLAASRDADSLAFLTDALHDDSPEVRAGAARAIADRGDPQALRPMIASLLTEREVEVQKQIADAVARFDVKKTKPLLLMALDEPHLPVQKSAAWALRLICWEALSQDRRAQIAIVHADWEDVVGYGRAAVKPLKKLLLEGSAHARRSSARALGEIGTAESYRALISVVDDTSLEDEVRKTAAWAFRSFSWTWIDDAHLATVAVLLEDWSAAVSLGPVAVRALIGTMRGKTTRVGEAAAIALGEIATEEAIGALTRTQADTSQDSRVRDAAAKSLKKNALDMLNVPDMAVRKSAARILEGQGWTPGNDRERVLMAIAQNKWSEVQRLGAAALEALLGLIEQSLECEKVASALVHLLTHSPDSLSTHQVRQLAGLPDFCQPADVRRVVRPGPRRPSSRVTCEEVREAAKLVEHRRRFN